MTMPTVTFDALYDHTLPYLPGVETPLLDFQIRKVARDFMSRTTLQREEFNFATVTGTDSYRLTPVYGEVCSIIGVWFDDHLLPPVPEASRPRANNGQPRGWWSVLPPILCVFPAPDDAYNLRVVAAIRPTSSDTLLDADIVAQHGEVLAAGVLSAMYAMPGKPWTKSDAAVMSGRAYGNALKTIRSTMRDGGQPNVSTFRAAARFGR